MGTCTTINAVRRLTATWRAEGRRVALVPTMGALHEGHLALVAAARRAVGDSGRVVVSVFVNPTQFGPGEDYQSYPRDPERDAARLKDAGVDGLFLPSVEEMYPQGASTTVEVAGLSRILIGRQRPGHFRGVTTVVSTLFHATTPDIACFGEKDYQQLVIIRKMVRDLALGVEIVPVPTVREADGLAMSSRNAMLTPQDRAAAPVLSQALDEAESLAADGASLATIRRRIRALINAEPRAAIRSIDIRDAETLSRISTLDRPVVILLAVRFGSVFLIDQRVVHP